MFQFKQFTIEQELCAMKVGTDGVLLGAWAQGGRRVLDVGTGTGIIALMMAQRYSEAQVVAIDIDEGAVRQARQNVAQSAFAKQVSVVQQAVQEHQGEYEAIVSNPPFFIDSLQALCQRQRLHTKHQQGHHRLQRELRGFLPQQGVWGENHGTEAREALSAGLQETSLRVREGGADHWR